MKAIETRTSFISFDEEEGFLRVVVKPDCEMGVEDARIDMKANLALTNSLKVPVMVDIRKLKYHSKEVRDFYASKEVAESIDAMAIVVESIATRMIGNFFIKINRPYFPTKMFDNQFLAEQWLKEILEKNLAGTFSSKK